MQMDFNDNWIFYREGDDPLEVTLPHDAMNPKNGTPAVRMV